MSDGHEPQVLARPAGGRRRAACSPRARRTSTASCRRARCRGGCWRGPAGRGRGRRPACPAAARAAARLTVVVVLPTPPFWLMTAIRRMACPPLQRLVLAAIRPALITSLSSPQPAQPRPPRRRPVRGCASRTHSLASPQEPPPMSHRPPGGDPGDRHHQARPEPDRLPRRRTSRTCSASTSSTRRCRRPGCPSRSSRRCRRRSSRASRSTRPSPTPSPAP